MMKILASISRTWRRNKICHEGRMLAFIHLEISCWKGLEGSSDIMDHFMWRLKKKFFRMSEKFYLVKFTE